MHNLHGNRKKNNWTWWNCSQCEIINIEAKLTEKKKRRVIPFWWKLSGVAAILLFGILGYTYFKQPENNSKTNLVNNTKDRMPIMISLAVFDWKNDVFGGVCIWFSML